MTQQQFVPQTQFQQFQPQPVQAPAPQQFAPQVQGGFGQQRPKGPNIWYRPVTQADYKKLAEMGTATIVVRILPGYNQAGLYEAIFEKNTANSKFPNSKRWLCPVMVLSDSLNPDRNGFVGVMEVSKTLYNRIKSKNTPANYFDFNAGHNFHINVSLSQSKDGQQWFPNYNKSGFEAQPSPCQAQYAASKMNEGKFADFATFMSRINNPKPQGPVAYGAPAQAPQGYAPQVAPQQFMPQPVAQTQFVPQAAPQQFVPQAAQQFVPQQVPQQQFAPQQMGQAAPSGPAGSEAEFDEIFGNQ
jgi:hypothetical protein